MSAVGHARAYERKPHTVRRFGQASTPMTPVTDRPFEVRRVPRAKVGAEAVLMSGVDMAEFGLLEDPGNRRCCQPLT